MRAIIMIVTDNKQLHLQILNKIMSEKQRSQLQKNKTIFFYVRYWKIIIINDEERCTCCQKVIDNQKLDNNKNKHQGHSCKKTYI